MRKARIIAVLIALALAAGCSGNAALGRQLTDPVSWDCEETGQSLRFAKDGTGQATLTDPGGQSEQRDLEWSIADKVLVVMIYEPNGQDYKLYNTKLAKGSLTLTDRDDGTLTVFIPKSGGASR